jgi:hypothetical protein
MLARRRSEPNPSATHGRRIEINALVALEFQRVSKSTGLAALLLVLFQALRLPC